MIKGSMMYDQYGRKRKVGNLYKSKKATPNFKKVAKKQFKRDEENYPSAPVGEYTVPEDNSYKQTSESNTRYRLLTTRVHTK